MPKLKTNKAARSRFKITASGKVLMQRTKRRHLLGDKSSAFKRSRRRWSAVDKTNTRQIKEALPYHSRGN